MTQIRGLAEIVLNVHNMNASLRLYRDLLGLKQISPESMKSPVFLQAGPEQEGIPQMIVLVQLPADAPSYTKPRTLHHMALTLPAASFDAEQQRLVEAGYSVRSGKHPVIPSRTLYIDDPDGNEVELICQA